jgi:hypothetical protein
MGEAGTVCPNYHHSLFTVTNLEPQKRWKLHLRPRTIEYFTGEDIPPLPRNKTAVQVLADFIQYLYKCTGKFIEEGHAKGEDMLRSYEHTTEFVLSYPNGWEGSQQTQIRNAAIVAGLVPDTREGRSRIHLVTEGEASLHYCFGSGPATDGFQVRLRFCVLYETNRDFRTAMT